MIKFGVSTFVWVSPFSTNNFNLINKVKNMGYDILEVAIENKDIIDWSKLKTLAKEAGLEVTISGAFGTTRDISSTDPAIRKEGLNYIIDCIKIAQYMDSPVFTGPVYSAVGKTRYTTAEQKKRERAWCIENLLTAGKIATDHNVIIGLEPLNRFETDMVNTVDQALSIVDEVSNPSLKVSLDTFHCNIEEKNIADSIRKIGKERLCHIQANESDRGTPGTGNLDWIGIKDALAAIKYEGAVVIETFGAPSKELAKAACVWRPLAKSADGLAIDGLAFYKKLFT
jgi:D-psicose/D-tagatose/L-ribulose 3-epimerase